MDKDQTLEHYRQLAEEAAANKAAELAKYLETHAPEGGVTEGWDVAGFRAIRRQRQSTIDPEAVVTTWSVHHDPTEETIASGFWDDSRYLAGYRWRMAKREAECLATNVRQLIRWSYRQGVEATAGGEACYACTDRHNAEDFPHVCGIES